MGHSVTEIQARLSDLGYLPALAPDGTSNIDGKFGERTLDAYNHYRATLGKGPVVKADYNEVLADLWPDEVPPPPAHKPTIFDELGALLSLVNLAKGKTMTADQLTGVVRAILALISGYFIARGTGDADMWNWIIAGVTGVIPVIWSWWSNKPKTIVPLASK